MLRVYLKATCTKCQSVVDLLQARGAAFETIDYYVEPLGPGRIRQLVTKTGGRPRDLLRTAQRPELEASDHTDEELIALMAEDPDLLGRPIVETGDRAVMARPAARALELLDGA